MNFDQIMSHGRIPSKETMSHDIFPLINVGTLWAI
jgi:hypothetical protein